MRALAAALGLAGLVALAAPGSTAGAATRTAAKVKADDTKGFVDVIEVRGYLDRVMEQFIRDSIEQAVDHHAEALVIQLDSPGSLLSSADLDRLESSIRGERRIPVTVWVGPLGARARGGAARLVSAASVVGVARGTHIGRSTPPPAGAPERDPLVGREYTWDQAMKRGIATIDAPVLVQFVGQLDGVEVHGRTLETARDVTGADGKVSPKPYGVRFAKLAMLPRLLHTATNPSIAYLLLVIALSLFVFEFFTGGIGVAAGVGIAAFVLAASGLGELPTRPLGLVLLALSMLGFAIDIQAGTPRFWTAVGTVSLVLGSLTLYGEGARVPLYWMAILTLMVVLFMVNGMPTMVRTRFATPTIGREAMIGELGEARGTIDPEGVVVVRGAPWRARTNRATPIPGGDPVRVVAIDGLLLEVEPLEGAAKDAGH